MLGSVLLTSQALLAVGDDAVCCPDWPPGRHHRPGLDRLGRLLAPGPGGLPRFRGSVSRMSVTHLRAPLPRKRSRPPAPPTITASHPGRLSLSLRP